MRGAAQDALPGDGNGGSRAEKPRFESGGEFIAQVRREVDEYLASPRTRRRGHLELYAKTAVAFSLIGASWSVLMFDRPGLVVGLLLLATLSFGAILTAFCVQHDANHGAYFRTRRSNHLMGWTADALLGFSSYTWRVKHNVAHHTYTNVIDYDDDISQSPFLRLSPVDQAKPWYRLQHLYIWPLYSLMVLRWQVGGDIKALVSGKIGKSSVHLPARWDLVGLLAGKAIFITWAIALPMLVYPWWVVLAGYCGFAMITGLVAATTFQLAHCVEDANFTSLEGLAENRTYWAVHEVETTVDFCRRNPVVTWVLGGLNFQIEHHLFPRVAHTHYARIAEIVERNSARYGVRYTSHPTLRKALGSHFRHLREMGKLGQPISIEMG